MTLYNTFATVSPSTRDPTTTSMLETGLVKLCNVPNRARSVEGVTLIGELAANVILVDKLSLIKDELVRIKIQARDIEKIRGIVVIFIEEVRYDVKFIPENNSKPHTTNAPLRPPARPETNGSEDEDLLGSEEERPRGSISKRSRDSSSGQKYFGGSYIGKQANNESRHSMDSQAQKVITELFREGRVDPMPIASYDQISRTIIEFLDSREAEPHHDSITQGKENQLTDNGKHLEEVNTKPGHITIHCEGEGSRKIRNEQWPTLKTPEELNSPSKTTCAEEMGGEMGKCVPA